MDPLLTGRILDANLPYYGFSHLALMEAAGKAIAEEVPKNVKRVEIFCGKGNNGGDGFVAARYLASRCQVRVILAGNPISLRTQEARRNWEILKHMHNIERVEITDSSQLRSLKIKGDLLIDALLGVGKEGTPQEPIASIIRFLNKSHIPIYAIDIPSGWNTELVCRATKILSLHSRKSSDAQILDIGIPPAFNTYTGPGNVRFLKRRDDNAHKGQFGHVAVIAGSSRYHGAPLYSALAAAKFVDMVSVFTHKENITTMKKLGPELIIHPLEKANGLDKFDSILIGPGLEPDEQTKQILGHALKTKRPCVLDATALRIGDPSRLHKECIITPHRSEYLSFFKEEADEKNLLRNAKNRGIILLKGMVDLISDGNAIHRNFSGNSGMAVGGTGDVLAGLCAAFAANNPVSESALAAAFLNGYAGDMMKGIPFSASDLLQRLQDAYIACQR